ncbi:tripartite tricarboxylate transporter substrate binding protein [Roseomonas sp. AR75]|uniref:Bug family tripartite tricarboxylate transporter substrate binding protein n=1 Tax=Roseomonas sp. AR75 TaxID=2562311 RepID=UPI00197F734D|nr:tripartite tricarboxylate transporter substrate binding protein [Roseomonas sp. AR75]
MSIPRRALARPIGLGLMLPWLWPRAVGAQEAWPSRPIRIVLPYTPGGGTDGLARTLASFMQGRLNQSVVVENRPGAGGNLATEFVANARPDGYTLLIGNQGPMTVNPTLFRGTMPVDPAEALVPIAMVAETQLVVVAGPGSRATTLQGLIDEARQANGRMTYATPSIGAAGHLAMALLLQRAGVTATSVPYRGAAPALNDVAAGHVAVTASTLPSVLGLIEGNKLRALAVTGDRRAAQLPNVPTVAETLPGYRVTAWYGLLAPRGTPAPILGQLAQAVDAALSSPEMLQRLRADGTDPYPMDAAAFAAFMREERTRWAEVIRAANIVAE